MNEAAATPIPRRGRIWVILAFAVALFALGYTLVDIATQKAGRDVVRIEGISTAQSVFGGIPQAGDRLGSADAPVSIQVFNDVQCGNCDEQFLETTPTLTNDYVRPGDVQLIYRHYSFSPRIVQEGFIAAEAAGEQGYQWQYVYLLFRNQAEAARVGVTSNLLSSIAGSIGELDVPKWETDFAEGGGEDGAITKQLNAQDETSQGLGLRAKPSAIVTGPAGTEVLQDGPGLGQIERAIEKVR
jgi:protein-disulfide isomerase